PLWHEQIKVFRRLLKQVSSAISEPLKMDSRGTLWVATERSRISDATVRQLSQHPGLLGLNISGRSTVTATGIAELKKCPNLRCMYFHGVPLSPELLNAITQLGELRVFMIRDVPVSREMVNAIVRLDKLEALTLPKTGITDDHLTEIAKLTKLRSLTLTNSSVTDKGLQSLKGLTSLTYLNLRNTQVTDAGVAEIKAALPECKVTGP
ncbi:MAG: hypothetical protein ABGZ53_07555, partial [Fuerstiella sp.]